MTNNRLDLAGDISLEEAASLAEEILGSWQLSKVETEVPAIRRPPALRFTWLTVRRSSVANKDWLLGTKARVDDYYSIELMNAVLGGAFTKS